MKRITGSVVVCAAAGALTAGALFYQPGASTSATPPPPGTLQIKGFTFSAAPVRRGATVTIVNGDSVDHTVTADGGSGFNVKARGGASVAFRAPTRAGTYTFFCSIHPEMTGTLVVA
jgi:plastocyanin